jgi:hypothetical protein
MITILGSNIKIAIGIIIYKKNLLVNLMDYNYYASLLNTSNYYTHPRSLYWDGHGHIDAVFPGRHGAFEASATNGGVAKVVCLILKEESSDLYFCGANATTNYTLH